MFQGEADSYDKNFGKFFRIFESLSKQGLDFLKIRGKITQVSGCSAGGSALEWGSRGREFESRHSDHKIVDKESFELYVNGFSFCQNKDVKPPFSLCGRTKTPEK